MSDAVDRVVVFMDYQNVHVWARGQFFPLKHGYPPDQETNATSLIVEQAEMVAEVDS